MDARTEAEPRIIVCRERTYVIPVGILAAADAVEAPLAASLQWLLPLAAAMEPKLRKTLGYAKARDALAVFDAARADSQGTAEEAR